MGFFFGDESKIIDVEIIEATPSELKPRLKVYENGFELVPCLINPGDNFLVKIVLQGFLNIYKIKSSARISGVKNVKQGFSLFNEPKPGSLYIILGIFIIVSQSFIPKFEFEFFSYYLIHEL